MKTVIITGANRGLGAALVQGFANADLHVIGTARQPSSLEKSNCDAHALDLAEAESVAAFADAVARKGDPVDLLIHNAGFNPKDRKDDPGYFQSTFSIKTFSAGNVAETLWINALMPMELTSRLLPSLAKDAVVLSISSWLGSIGGKTSGGHYGYAGSKALLNMFTRALALEFAGDEAANRAAVALNPGWMRTDMGGQNAETTPEDVAEQVLVMWSDGALHRANGEFLNSDGTRHAW